MIMKEQFKPLQLELEEHLEVLHIPKYVWHWPELLANTLKLLCTVFYPQGSTNARKAFRAWQICREIYE